MPTTLTTRQREILTAIVEQYIATGEPVSSGAIARLETLPSGPASSATIRNEMAELAEQGLLEQPHTSAGRVPSARAFRLYVEQLNGARLDNLGPSTIELQSRIDTSFAGIAGAEALLERTSHVLAVLSSGVGLAMSTASSHDTLEHVHFSRLAERRVLAVVVTRSGMVRDRVLSLDRELTTLDLETASRFLNEHFRGWSMERIRTELARRIETERSAYQQMMEAAQQLWNQTVGAAAGAQAVFVDGVANLLGLPEDRARLREMLTALEAKERLIELLNAYIDARQESVRVVFDLEQHAPEMAGLVLIAAPARVAGENLGSVGVIGPKRMNYPSNMNAVAYIAQMLERALTPRSS
ncbi:MAG TPA: heat-inducible transcriptional repressor HrcA [Candidatus Aquilonibacter sp.]|nr:heat-inducible transcriptional repressor HrcA [Candidatus Aquilonibacter sp.]